MLVYHETDQKDPVQLYLCWLHFDMNGQIVLKLDWDETGCGEK